ncbi:YdiU family protein [Endozoicomonas sp. OPT23]|uniref:protein adenylyltransferase SelO n=1 Tax=Endozoicomonas sp. OPT23 TaxID=2072845 RepID=UPI001DE4C003|nr:YdiU family protein [Endozoicomonas sp. OPT23]
MKTNNQTFSDLADLQYENSFGQLPEAFYTRLQATPLQNSRLVTVSKSAAELLDLNLSDELKEQLAQVCSGQEALEPFDPLAMVYSGHQFGGYSPQLGDGRGLLLGEVRNSKGEKWDLHLKGAGQTPYSRFGDGRAVLRSCIREYLASEALYHLGIPTTRALCIVTSDTPIYRETEERGSTLLRLAKTHIRFGHFEYFYYTKQHDELKILADHTIEQHFPELTDKENKYSLFFRQVIEKTALLIAKWQVAGFAHGVMNTDNMSILGDTFDFGPYGFQDDFDWHFICNHSDHSGRYAFSKQAEMGYWNCARLAQALLPLMDVKDMQPSLDAYPQLYSDTYKQLMLEKLGLTSEEEEDGELVQKLLQLLHDTHCDYTLFFRALSDYQPDQQNDKLLNLFPDLSAIQPWLKLYAERLKRNLTSDKQRSENMKQVNPKFILRNYLAQQVIEKAEQGDYSELEELMVVLQSPFDEHPDLERFAQQPPEWGRKLEVSCSS